MAIYVWGRGLAQERVEREIKPRSGAPHLRENEMRRHGGPGSMVGAHARGTPSDEVNAESGDWRARLPVLASRYCTLLLYRSQA